MKWTTLIFCCVIATSSIQGQQIEADWCLFEATDGGTFDMLPAISVDSTGNLTVLGEIYVPSHVLGIATFKYDKNGNKLWEQRYQTPASDYLTAYATDKAGAVYIASKTIQDPFGNPNNNILIKYGGNGDLEWQIYPDVEGYYLKGIGALLTDEENNLLSFGSYIGGSQDGKPGIFIQKRSPFQNVIWTSRYETPGYDLSLSKARRVGNTWVAWGYKLNMDLGEKRLICWQVDLNGHTVEISDTELQESYHVLRNIDREGNLLTNLYGYSIYKFNVQGELEWSHIKPQQQFPQFVVPACLEDIITDNDQNVYATGFVRLDSALVDPIVMKLSPLGEVLWEEHESGLPGTEQRIRDRLFLLNDGHIVATCTYKLSPSGTQYQPFYEVYDSNGLVSTEFSNIPGPKNYVGSLVSDGNYFYVTGISTPSNFLDTLFQFVCKYPLSELVSVQEVNQGNQEAEPLKIFPNPAGEQCRISWQNTTASNRAQLRVYTSEGNLLTDRELPLSTGLQEWEIPGWPELPAGMYFVQVSTDSGCYGAKVVKGRMSQ